MIKNEEMSDRTYYGILISIGIIFIICTVVILGNAKSTEIQLDNKCSKMKCENTKPRILNDDCVCITMAK